LDGEDGGHVEQQHAEFRPLTQHREESSQE
jgi:hypothetical protein